MNTYEYHTWEVADGLADGIKSHMGFCTHVATVQFLHMLVDRIKSHMGFCTHGVLYPQRATMQQHEES